MINLQEAEVIALEHLAVLEKSAGEGLSLLREKTIEKSFGWVFFYNSSSYQKTGDTAYMLAGNSPLIVDRNTGQLFETGTSQPIEKYISEYEEKSISR